MLGNVLSSEAVIIKTHCPRRRWAGRMTRQDGPVGTSSAKPWRAANNSTCLEYRML